MSSQPWEPMAEISHVITSKLSNRFELKRSLASGPTQTVLLAHDRELQRDVAIKVLTNERGNSSGKQSWKREVDAAIQVRHPNIVACYDYLELGSANCLVMQYVPGGDWTKYDTKLNQERSRTVQVMIKLCSAVDYLHRLGWVHCDLKPDNVLVDSDGEPLLSDFGCAQPITGDPADNVKFNGTPNYLAPECAAGESAATVSSDVYSMGILLLDRIVGKPPFSGSTASILNKVIHEGPPSLRALGESVDHRLQAIIDKATQRSPQQRYGSAAELAEDLQRYLDNQPIIARRTNTLGKLILWGQRNPVGASLVTALLIVTLMGILISSWNWRLAFDERRRLVESESRLNAEAEILEASEGDLVSLLARLETERAEAKTTEEVATKLRDQANLVRQQRLNAVQEARRLESEAKEKQRSLQEKVAESKAANEVLLMVADLSQKEQSRLDETNVLVDQTKYMDLIDAAVDAVNEKRWGEAGQLLGQFAEDDQGYLFHRISLAVENETWEPPQSKIALPFRPDRVATTANSESILTLAKNGRGTLFRRNEPEQRSEFALLENGSKAIADITAVGFHSGGNRFAVSAQKRDGSHLVKCYRLEKPGGDVEVVLEKAVAVNFHAIRYQNENAFALVSSTDQKKIGVMDLAESKLIWQWDPPDDSLATTGGPILNCVVTRCHPLNTLVFTVQYAGKSRSEIQVVSVDFAGHLNGPDIHASRAMLSSDKHWNEIFVIHDSLVIQESTARHLHFPLSLPTKFLQSIPMKPELKFAPLGFRYSLKIYSSSRIWHHTFDTTNRLMALREGGMQIVDVRPNERDGRLELSDVLSLPVPVEAWTLAYRQGTGCSLTPDRAFLLQAGTGELYVYQLSKPVRKYRALSDFRADLDRLFPAAESK